MEVWRFQVTVQHLRSTCTSKQSHSQGCTTHSQCFEHRLHLNLWHAGQDAANASTVCFVLHQPSSPLSHPFNSTKNQYTIPKQRGPPRPHLHVHSFSALQATRQAFPVGSTLPSFTLQADENSYMNLQPSTKQHDTTGPSQLAGNSMDNGASDSEHSQWGVQTYSSRRRQSGWDGDSRRVIDSSREGTEAAACSVDENGSVVTIRVALPGGLSVTVQSTAATSTHEVPWGRGQESSPEEWVGMLGPLLRLRWVP